MKTNKLLQLLRDNARAENVAPLRIEASADSADIYVNDVIDANWGVGAASLISALASADGKDVVLHINSPGGDVFEARAMSAAIVAHKGKVTAQIDGCCASAATYLALACNEVRMTDGALFMVHNSWTLAMGDKNDLIETADLLDKIDSTIVSDYVNKTGASTDTVKGWMDATTWFTAQEALDAKLIDAIDPNTKATKSAKAQWNLSAYPNAPQVEAPEPESDLTARALAQVQTNRNRLRLLDRI